jgi:hypothetical protein
LSHQYRKDEGVVVDSMQEYWYKGDMDWAWIAFMTLKLTRANLIRLKDAFMKFVTTNPELSAVGFFVILIAAVILIFRYARSGC